MAAILYLKMAIEFIFYFDFLFEWLTKENVGLDTKKTFLGGVEAEILRYDNKYGGILYFKMVVDFFFLSFNLNS